jgi:gustatory receptor
VAKIYNRVSLVILIIRMLAVYFYAADVNNAATMPLRLLKELPTSTWNLEIRRFYDQLRYDSAGLSAMGFFTFNRSIILSVASTIVTYEIVMIQNELNTVYKPSRVGFCETIGKLVKNILVTE